MSNDILTEVKFWSQVIGDARRTVWCSPDLESRVKGWIDARGMGGLITVVANPACPDNQIMIIDEQALQANLNEVLARPVKFSWTPLFTAEQAEAFGVNRGNEWGGGR